MKRHTQNDLSENRLHGGVETMHSEQNVSLISLKSIFYASYSVWACGELDLSKRWIAP